MEGVIDGGVGIGLKTSPRQAAIEKAQAELRREYEVREERKRELEFLEKGGNLLDFKFGNVVSASVQSTSLTDHYQHHEQFEAKGSFALTVPLHGDSVDSTARPGGPSVSKPDTDAHSPLIFGIDNELAKGERRPLHQSRRNNVAPSEQSSKTDGSQNAKDSKDSAIFRQYARRKRSRTNHGFWGSSRDGKGLVSETSNLKDHTSPNGDRDIDIILDRSPVNAEVDSMGGVIDGEVGIGLKTSPRRAAIEKAQAELRQECEVREERKRELEFLEKGGNLLDFKFGNVVSASVQSTSLTDHYQHHEQFVTSEAKGNFSLTASPHGDSVDNSARPGTPYVSEPNTADNLLVWGIDNELAKGERRPVHQSRRNNVAPSEQSSKIGGSQNAKDSEDCDFPHICSKKKVQNKSRSLRQFKGWEGAGI
ncbi:hypothetical protein K1719_021803 [Acacia pycnantha]|nr:hypothetical protein K1719_021803 [Acacia pycnantha]